MERIKIGVIGLGYVGLPLALEFSKKYQVVGYDIKIQRIEELKAGFDRTEEVEARNLNSPNITFSSNDSSLEICNVYIITVPTPIDKFKKPDLYPLLSASELVGRFLKTGDYVIYESTVYPGCTEEDCVPILERISNLTFNKDFFCGYSPERINPGDRINTLTKIKKVTSGSTSEAAVFVDNLYKSIINAGTYMATSIRVAEASKAIENAQRDVNISFVNELALIFNKMGIDTNDVLEAAGTKWNFLDFKPGLVGGHCIGVDPYYLLHKSESLGYYPQVILSGRKINDNMGVFVANRVIKLMIKNGHLIDNANVLILGITFKENCPDTRNSRVIDVYNELKEFNINVSIHDPHAKKDDVFEEYGISLIDNIYSKNYDAIILAVSHHEFSIIDFLKIKKENTVIFDIKGVLDRHLIHGRL